MTSKEMKYKLDTLAKVNELMGKIYRSETFGKLTYFVNGKGTIFKISAFPGRSALVIEYADDGPAAAKGVLEDGDQFYLDDYQDIDALIAAMREEIEA